MLRWILTDIDWFLLIVKIRYIFDCHMKISLLSFSSIFDDVIKKAQNNSKMAIVGPGIFFTSTFTSRFQIPEQQIADGWKNSRSGMLGRKYLRNLAFGFPRIPAESHGKGLKMCFSPLWKMPVCFSVLTKSKK